MVTNSKYVMVVNPRLYNESKPNVKYEIAMPQTIDAMCWKPRGMSTVVVILFARPMRMEMRMLWMSTYIELAWTAWMTHLFAMSGETRYSTGKMLPCTGQFVRSMVSYSFPKLPSRSARKHQSNACPQPCSRHHRNSPSTYYFFLLVSCVRVTPITVQMNAELFYYLNSEWRCVFDRSTVSMQNIWI